MPEPFREEPAVAAGALAERLLEHPDLEALPDELQLVVTLLGGDDPEERYHLFRFRYGASHPTAAFGWMAGVVGPFGGGPANQSARGSVDYAATALEQWAARTPDEHLHYLRYFRN